MDALQHNLAVCRAIAKAMQAKGGLANDRDVALLSRSFERLEASRTLLARPIHRSGMEPPPPSRD